MPVIPPNVPAFTITAPLTTGDKGQPSASIALDVKRVWDLIQDERHLVADSLYQSVKERVDAWQSKQQQHDQQHLRHHKRGMRRVKKHHPSKVDSEADKEMKETIHLLQERKDIIEKLEVS